MASPPTAPEFPNAPLDRAIVASRAALSELERLFESSWPNPRKRFGKPHHPDAWRDKANRIDELIEQLLNSETFGWPDGAHTCAVRIQILQDVDMFARRACGIWEKWGLETEARGHWGQARMVGDEIERERALQRGEVRGEWGRFGTKG